MDFASHAQPRANLHAALGDAAYETTNAKNPPIKNIATENE